MDTEPRPVLPACRSAKNGIFPSHLLTILLDLIEGPLKSVKSHWSSQEILDWDVSEQQNGSRCSVS